MMYAQDNFKMNTTILSTSDVAGMLMGAGLVKLNDNLNVALILIGVGVGLKVLLAVLNKSGIVITTPSSK